MEKTPHDSGIVYRIELDEGPSQELTITSDLQVEFEDVPDGFHLLRLTVIQGRPNSIKINALQLDQRFSDRIAAVRAHETPNGVHQSWSTPRTRDHQMIVLECESFGSKFCFAPMNTPFGYFGPVFEGSEITRLNMSFWNTREIRPPTMKSRSHIVAIGSSKGTFQSYGREDSTSKVNDWNPFQSKSRRVVLGLRYTHTHPYTTYYGYYWDEEEAEWELFSIGNKYSSKPRTKFNNLGGFMEIPSVRTKNRDGHLLRSVRRRGWVCDSNGTWHGLTNSVTQLQRNVDGYTTRRFEADGEYFMCHTGGFKYYRVVNSNRYLSNPPQPLPKYMTPQYIKQLTQVAFEPVIRNVAVQDGKATITFKTRTALASRVTIFYGPTNPNTTIVDWVKRATFEIAAKDRRNQSHQVEVEVDAKDKYFRMLVQTSEAQIFTPSTFSK